MQDTQSCWAPPRVCLALEAAVGLEQRIGNGERSLELLVDGGDGRPSTLPPRRAAGIGGLADTAIGETPDAVPRTCPYGAHWR